MKKNSKSLALALLSIFVMASLIVAVKTQVPNQQNTMQKKAQTGVSTQWIPITVNGSVIWMDFYAQDVWYDTNMLSTEIETTISVGDFSGYSMTVNDLPIEPKGTVSLKLRKLKWDQGIKVAVTDANGAVRRLYIRTLPSSYYDAVAVSNNPEDGYYYFNLNNNIYKMTTNGEIVFFKKVEKADMADGGMDFKRTEVDGKVYYSYLTGYTPADRAPLNGVGYGRMRAVVMDQNYNEIDQVNSLIPNQRVVENHPLENHQFTILGEKHYILSAYVGKRVTNINAGVAHSKLGARVVACVLQEIKDGKLLWQWDSTEHPELYSMSVDGNDFYNQNSQWADYAHFNAIYVDPKDNNFICSFRHLNAILKLDRKTGKILWVLGGKEDQFNLLDNQLFSHQHDVRIASDGGITLFDNGNIDTINAQGHTRIVKLYLDEKSKTVKKFKEYSLEKAFSPYMGGVVELSDDHFIIGWGGRKTQLPLFSEVDFKTGKVLFELSYPITANSYRVYKFSK